MTDFVLMLVKVLLTTRWCMVVCQNSCPDTYYGPNCEYRCSKNCANSMCHSGNGACHECIATKRGQYCTEDCPRDVNDVTFGPDCQYNCSTNCLQLIHQCYFIEETCGKCNEGRMGKYCEKECQEKYFGIDCKYKCSSACVDERCYSYNGTCLECPIGKTGDFCDEEEQIIKITDYKFLDIDGKTLITRAGNLTFEGNVTLKKDGNEVSVLIPAGSHVTVGLPPCIDDIDDCKSGFSITDRHSFSSLDEGRLVVMTTGAGLEEGVKGVTLYYECGYLYCFVVTSTQQWIIQQPFSLVENEWYNMTVSWHPVKGLFLYKGNQVINSSVNPVMLPEPATTSKKLLLGSTTLTSSQTVMQVSEFATLPSFWLVQYVEEASSDGSTLETTQIIGIAVGCTASLVIAVVAVTAMICYFRRKPSGDDGSLNFHIGNIVKIKGIRNSRIETHHNGDVSGNSIEVLRIGDVNNSSISLKCNGDIRSQTNQMGENGISRREASQRGSIHNV